MVNSEEVQTGGVAAGPVAETTQPVAWRYRSAVGDENSQWLVTTDPKLAAKETAYPNQVEPLYLSQPQGELREALRKLPRYSATGACSMDRDTKGSWIMLTDAIALAGRTAG